MNRTHSRSLLSITLCGLLVASVTTRAIDSVFAVSSNLTGGESLHQQRSAPPGAVKPRVKDGDERPALNGATVPFPGSVHPMDVIRNIQALAQQSHLDKTLDLPELAVGVGAVRMSRLLRVKSNAPSPGYLVAELEDANGQTLADIALTRNGVILAVQKLRGEKPVRALGLDEVKSRLDNLGRPVTRIEYEYFHNVAEPGFSYFRPLVAATTARGVVYVNSRNEAFAEEGSQILREFGEKVSSGRSRPLPANLKQLRQLAGW